MSSKGQTGPRLSVIICTYNDARALDLILCALARQSRMPEEVIIADDGSGPETAAVIESWRPRLDTRLEHAWHIDNGFRKSRISNEAVRRATGEYLVFLDGDSISAPPLGGGPRAGGTPEPDQLRPAREAERRDLGPGRSELGGAGTTRVVDRPRPPECGEAGDHPLRPRDSPAPPRRSHRSASRAATDGRQLQHAARSVRKNQRL